MMKTFRLFSMAALALMMAACSSEDNILETASPAMPGKLLFTATVEAPGTGATTRTVYTEDTDAESKPIIKVAWKENDKIAAIVINSENKYVKTELTVSKVNADGSAVISGDIAKPKDDALTVDLIYPASIVTIDNHGILCVSYDKMRDGSTLDGTLKSIYENIDYRRANGCALTVSGDKATLTSAAKLESKLSIWKLTLKKEDNSSLSATQVAIADGAGVMASATLTSAASEVYLPVPAASGIDIAISATVGSSDTYYYQKKNVTLEAKKYYQSTVQMTKGAHLALLTADYVAKDGETLTGTLASNVKISIADGATVTLKDVQINESGTCTSGDYAGITSGDNSIINLEGTNTVKGFADDYPGIYVPDGKTLTIQGTGSLTASSGVDSYGHLSGAGIGGGYKGTCGNIVIKGGTITATGGNSAAGIGSCYEGSCGAITISGGTVTATGGAFGAGIGGGSEGSCGTISISGGTVEATGGVGGAGIGGGQNMGNGASCGNINISGGTVIATGSESAAGIGGGYEGSCGNITISGGTITATGYGQAAGIGGGYMGTCGNINITSDVTKVTATKGEGANNSIGAGNNGTCGTVTIGGTEYASGISQSPYEYPLPALSLTNPAVGQVIGSDGKNYAAASVPLGVDKVAMIAYVSGTHGLAIQLNGSPVQKEWADAKTYAAGLKAFTGGMWRLPSKEDWQNMFAGCAVSGDAIVPDAYYKMEPIAGFKAKIAATGITWMSNTYWSSTETTSPNAWYVRVSLNGSTARAEFGDFNTTSSLYVLGCLAF